MPFRRLENEPVRRARRAQRLLARYARDQADDWAEAVPDDRDSAVVARTRAAQSRLERNSPARSVALSFLVLVAVGTGLLMLPGMRAGGGSAPVSTALFTSTSASCVTGLAVVDTATYWTPLGQAVILLLVQVGGFGIQALGTLWILLLSRRLGTRSRLATQAETGVLTQGDVREVLLALAVITVVVEGVIAVLLTLRFWLGYDGSLGHSAWFGLFHAVSAFNNAGFALDSSSLMDYGHDVLILGPLSLAVVLGGLGFLVIVELFSRATGGRSLIRRPAHPSMTVEEVRARGLELAQRGSARLGGLHPQRFGFHNPIPLSLHTRLMLIGTGLLWAVGTLCFALFEWRNPATLGGMPWWERAVQSVFSGAVTPRTAGFNSVDYAQVRAETRFLTDGLMFTGAGSGSTAGGIKVTTLMVLAVAVLAEVRGNKDVNVLDRRIPDTTVRVAIAVALVSLATVMVGTMALLSLTDLTLDLAAFEVISALATVGLSANVTPTLAVSAQLLLVALMFLGRVGPLTLASSLTLRSAPRSFRLPEGRPMIG